MVIEALGVSVLGWSGPTTSGISAVTKVTAPYSTQRVTAGGLVIGTFGSRGGRCMRSGSGGSRVITTTEKMFTKKLRNSTISGVMATPLLMLNSVAVTNSRISVISWLIWYRMYETTLP